MIDRKCFYCKQPGGRGPRELRPYGPGGADVCAECTFETVIGPHMTGSMVVSPSHLFRGEELVVKTPEHFRIRHLFNGGDAVVCNVADGVPAWTYAETSSLELRQLPPFVCTPWPSMSITLSVTNTSDQEQHFKAIIKGKRLVKP